MDELGTAVKVLPDLFKLTGASTLLFLPLAHVFARIIQVGCVMMRVKVGHTADVKNLVADLGEFKPTFILSVPRVFEKVFNTASQTAHASGKGKIFDAAAETAIAYSQALDKGGPSFGLKAKHTLFDKLVYAKLRNVLGGEVDYAVSGGAPLGDRLGHFFRGIGVPVLEGYGLTETTAALAVNLPDDIRIGTVGKPLPGVTVGVAEDGELCFKGGQVMLGYWKNDEATAAAIDADGWFHTGDLGEFDVDGFIKITGRKKEILVTAGGKNVAPAVLEDRIRLHPLVSQCMVVGDGKPFIAALVTIDPETIGAWAAKYGKPNDMSTLATDKDLIAEIQSAVDDANTAVSKAEGIKKFTILEPTGPRRTANSPSRVGHVRILYVGNSFTARNNLPGLVASLAKVRGQVVEHRLISAGWGLASAAFERGYRAGGHRRGWVERRGGPAGAEHSAGQERGADAGERAGLRCRDQSRRRADRVVHDVGSQERPGNPAGADHRVRHHRRRTRRHSDPRRHGLGTVPRHP